MYNYDPFSNSEVGLLTSVSKNCVVDFTFTTFAKFANVSIENYRSKILSATGQQR